MFFGEVPIDQAVGAILAHSRKLPSPIGSGRQRTIKKGHVLTAADVEAMAELGLKTITVARLDPDDVGEDVAAAKIAAALAGPGLEARAPFTGRANLFARVDGLLQLDMARLDATNFVDEAVTVATLAPDSIVQAGQMVATIKIIPFAVPDTTLDVCLVHAGQEAQAAIDVVAFKRPRATLIQTRLPDTPERMLDKTSVVMRQRLDTLGVELGPERRCNHSVDELKSEIAAVAAEGTQLILVAGASAIVDRRDVVPQALVDVGGDVHHFGMPVDPGNLLMIGAIGEANVVGLPGCARSPKYNGLDMVLGRLAVGLPVERKYIMGLGGAGLLKEFASRPQPRKEKGVSKRTHNVHRISAVVLAAGQSRRMGNENKLLMELVGRPLLAVTIDAVRASKVVEVIVVTGHESDRIEAAFKETDVRFVRNPDYKDGLSTSLKTGAAAVDPHADGVIFCLGDMPRVDTALIDSLIDAFDPVEGRAICVPIHHGKRGNPVLWSVDYLDDIRRVVGDTGARHLIGENEEAVVEVPVAREDAFLDVDTPQMLDEMRTRLR